MVGLGGVYENASTRSEQQPARLGIDHKSLTAPFNRRFELRSNVEAACTRST
jgi:hypothetical protein